jgi:hypothetical protein
MIIKKKGDNAGINYPTLPPGSLVSQNILLCNTITSYSKYYKKLQSN